MPEGSRWRSQSLEELVALVTRYFAIDSRELARRGSRHPARPVLALLAKRYCDRTLRELARVLGVKRPNCVPHLVDRARDAEANSALAVAHR